MTIEPLGGLDGAVDADLVKAVDDAIVELVEPAPERAGRELGYDPADFGHFYARYRSPLARRARRFFGDPRDVDEVVQDTFIKVFLALPELETEVAAVRFAHRVLTNLCIDRYRQTQRRPSNVDISRYVDDFAVNDDVADPMVRAEDAAIVRDALARLTPEHRDALIKREVEEKDLALIAVEMGVAEHQVKHLLYRARRSLRRLLVGTAVDPAVDLTISEIADHAGRRAVAAARSGPVRVIAVLLLVGGVGAASVGTLHRPSGPTSVAVGTPSVSAPELLGPGPVAHGSGPSRPTAGPRHHAGVDHRSRVGRTAEAPTGPTSGDSSPAAATTSPANGTKHPHAPKPTGNGTNHTPRKAPSYRVTGLVNADHAAVTDQVRVLQADAQYRSSAHFRARSAQGEFAMAQTLDITTADGTVAPSGAVLNISVPYPNQTVGYLSSAYPKVTITPAAGGYAVDVSTTAQPTGVVVGAPALHVIVHATYDEALTAVQSETVSLTSLPSAGGTASSGAPVADPTAGVAPAPAPTVAVPPASGPSDPVSPPDAASAPPPDGSVPPADGSVPQA